MLNRRSLLISILSSVLSFGAIAATQVASSSKVSLFTGSSLDWTSATSTTLGSVKVLKSTGNTEFYLSLQIPNLGISGTNKTFLLDSVNSLGASHTRITQVANIAANGYGNCVDFAKVMIGNTSQTSTWHALASNKLSAIPSSQWATMLKPGTMIAYFNGSSIYPGSGGHVAIILSANSTGVTVVDQNFANGYTLKVGTTSYAASATTLLSIHTLPWMDTAAIRSANQYHIVDLY